MSSLRLNGGRFEFDRLFLDCDGVIFDSNPMKLRAMRAAVAGYPREDVAMLLHLHRTQGGVSRYEKLRRFFTEIHPVTDIGGEVTKALERFAAVSREGYADLEPIPGALEFTKRVGGPRTHVVSGSDENELRAIFDELELLGKFAGVHGSPREKPEHLRRILSKADVAFERFVFVGDGRADFEATCELGGVFVFLARYSEWDDADQVLEGAPRTLVANDWSEILARLE